jgi:hypothetical protein
MYDNLKNVLEKVQYSLHEWMICGDFKVLSMLLGQNGGYTKFPCFYVNGIAEQLVTIGIEKFGLFEVI